MNATSVDIKDYLLQQSALSGSTLELTFGTNLYISILPETSVITTAIMDSSGGQSEPNNLYRPVIQILTRGLEGEYTDAYDKINDIVEELHTLANTTIGGTNYIQVWKLSDINFVGNDTQNRPVFSCSLQVQRS